uniref:Uncharacterized protein n=1 Tax=Anguilla anguilla TaxID=7936 RepID=A0A0E9UB63_ANGAN
MVLKDWFYLGQFSFFRSINAVFSLWRKYFFTLLFLLIVII